MGKKFDYTWSCDCGTGGSTAYLNEARKDVRKHLKSHTDKTPNWEAYIDQYDLGAGELSGKYYKIVKNH
jgi:hypothetical protein